LQQVATSTGSKAHSQAAKNPVVEHKGSSDEVVDFVLYLAHVRSFWASDDPGQLSATCPMLYFSGEIPSRSGLVIPF
jgi:hypothetical protein